MFGLEKPKPFHVHYLETLGTETRFVNNLGRWTIPFNLIQFYLPFDTQNSPRSVFIWKYKFTRRLRNVCHMINIKKGVCLFMSNIKSRIHGKNQKMRKTSLCKHSFLLRWNNYTNYQKWFLNQICQDLGRAEKKLPLFIITNFMFTDVSRVNTLIKWQ